MDLLSPELTIAIAAAAGALVANSSRWLFRWIGNYVRGTPNKLDDRIFEAAREALHVALDERPDLRPTDG